MKKWSIALFVTAALGGASPASALNFDFSFSEADGTVMGEIIGLADSGTSTATDVIVGAESPDTTGS
jgi:hypothetical protein